MVVAPPLLVDTGSSGPALRCILQRVDRERIYEWDEAKNRSNFEKHGVGFEAISRFGWTTAINRRSDRQGEERWAAIGYIDSRLHHVVYTERGDNTRIISLRTASRIEKEDYEHRKG